MGLVSFMGGNANQKVAQSTGNGLLPDGGTSVGGPAKPLVGKMNGGGAAGFIFNNFVQPFANSTSKLTADAAGLVGAGIEATHGKYGKQGMADAYLNSTPVAQAFNSQAGNGLGKQLEAAGGDVGGDVLNVASPFVGGEAFAGAKGLGALLKTGAKVGAGIGGASGIANAAAQGGSAQDVALGGLAGLGEGAVTGAAGGAVARGIGGATNLVGKLTGKGNPAAADIAGAGAEAAAGNAPKAGIPGVQLGRNAAIRTGQAQAATENLANAQSTFNTQTAPFENLSDKTLVQHDLSGTQNFMKNTLGMEPTPENMAKAHEAITGDKGVLANFMRQSLDNTPQRVNVGDVMTTVHEALDQHGIGDTRAKGTVGNDVANSIQTLVDGKLKASIGGAQKEGKTLPPTAAANDAFNTIQAIGKKMASLSNSDKDVAMKAGLQAAKNHLEESLGNEAGVNQVISDAKLAPTGPGSEEHIRTALANQGFPKQVADYIVNGINKTEGPDAFGMIRSLQKAPFDAGQLAKAAENYAKGPGTVATAKAGVKSAATNPALKNTPGGNRDLSTTYEAGSAMRGNPAAVAVLASKAVKTNAASNLLAKLAPNVREQAYRAALRSPEELAAEATGGTPAGGQPPQAGPSAPPPAMTSMAANPGGIQSIIGALTGQAANQVGQNAGVPQTASTQPTGQADTTSIDQLSQTEDQLNNPQPTLDPSTVPGGTLQDLEAEIQADPKNATTYKEIYDEVQKQVAASAPQKLNATEAKNLTNIQNATAALNHYVQGLNSLSDSTRGAGVGQLSALLGKVGLGGANGNTAAQLESNKEELAIQLAQAMNNGNKPQGAQIEEIKKMLPSVGDPKALAARKIDQLSANLSDYLGIATGASVSNRNSGNTSRLLAGLAGGGQQ